MTYSLVYLNWPHEPKQYFKLNWDDKQQIQAQSDGCKVQMAFPSARWCWEFKGTPWSNKSGANLPEGDTKPPGGDNPWNLLFICSINWTFLNNFTAYVRRWALRAPLTDSHENSQSVLTKPLYNKELHSHIHSIIFCEAFLGPLHGLPKQVKFHSPHSTTVYG